MKNNIILTYCSINPILECFKSRSGRMSCGHELVIKTWVGNVSWLVDADVATMMQVSKLYLADDIKNKEKER